MFVCACLLVCLCMRGPGTVVALVTMGRKEGWPSEWFMGGGRIVVEGKEWLAQGSSPSVRGHRGSPATAGTGRAGEKKDPFS